MTETIQGGGGKYYTVDDTVSIAKAITVPSGSQMSGQITVTTAGTAVQGPDMALTNGAIIKALSTNTGVVYVGNDGAGDVASTNGYELAAGDLYLASVENLDELWFDAATGGDKFCWVKV